ncbi:MAG: hypothetical protein HOE11_02050 [Candidatus Diapherotrites archaeon]|jgi:hypothetical protein|nr:hypothetical protein [Candidatus Diapherotrites archaeon]MBT4596908.1 hypothetical protein [Candidatus Diapherotrites archaeon]
MKPVQLVVWAVIAIVLIALVLFYFGGLEQEETLVGKIKQNFLQAENPDNLGNLFYLGEEKIERDSLITKGMFDLLDRELSFECTSTELCCPQNEACNKDITWDYDYLKTKNQVRTSVYLRCIKDIVPICRVYVGKEPAQARIIKIDKTQVGSKIILEVATENSGEFDMAFGNVSMLLEKKVGKRWVNTGEVFEEQTVNRIAVSFGHIFVIEFETPVIGEYRSIITFEGQNAGFDEEKIEFTFEENTFCKTRENEDTLPFGDEFREMHYCSGCNFAYECLAKWNEQDPVTTYELIDKESVYCLKTTLDGNC